MALSHSKRYANSARSAILVAYADDATASFAPSAIPLSVMRANLNSQLRPMPSQSRTVRALVVDDHMGIADGLSQLLGLFDIDARAAYSGHDAIDKFSSWKPDVIFMDIDMPGLDGYETTRTIRASPEGDAVHIIALTARSSPEDRKRVVQSGFDAHLIKPAPIATILSIIDLCKVRTPD